MNRVSLEKKLEYLAEMWIEYNLSKSEINKKFIINFKIWNYSDMFSSKSIVKLINKLFDYIKLIDNNK